MTILLIRHSYALYFAYQSNLHGVGVAPLRIPIMILSAIAGVDGKLRSPSDDAKAGSSSVHMMKSQHRRAKKAKGKKSKGKTSSGEECIVQDEDENEEEVQEAFELLGKCSEDPTYRATFTEDELAEILEPFVDEVNELMPDGYDPIDHDDVLKIWSARSENSQEDAKFADLFNRQLVFEVTPACAQDILGLVADVISIVLYAIGLGGSFGREKIVGMIEKIVYGGNIFLNELLNTWSTNDSTEQKIADTFLDFLRVFSPMDLVKYIYDHSTWYETAVSGVGLVVAITAAVASGGASIIASGVGFTLSTVDMILNLSKAVTKDCVKKVDGKECSTNCQGTLGGRGCCQEAGQSEICWLNDASLHTSCNNCEEEGKCYIDMTILKRCSDVCRKTKGGYDCCVNAGQKNICTLNLGSPWTSCNNCMDEGPCEINMEKSYWDCFRGSPLGCF